MKNYCITSAICDSEGTIYYKNDSGYMMALEKAVMPTIETTLEDGMVQRGSKRRLMSLPGMVTEIRSMLRLNLTARTLILTGMTM